MVNFQQRDSDLFTDRNELYATYDAHEKDIAVVSFYFEKPTVVENTRYHKIAMF